MRARTTPPRVLAIAAVALLAAATLQAQRPARSTTLTQPRTSPHDVVSSTFDGQRMGNRVMLVYGRPFSKDPRSEEIRTVWGGVVPWGERWRLGADEATLLITQQPLTFGSLQVPAGAYSLYMLPVEQGASQLIINRQIGQWGMYEQYQEGMELGRVALRRETVAERVDQFTLTLESADTGGVLRITWENLSFTAPFTVGQ